MRILGISSTPRRGGNSEILLDAALHPFREAGWDVTRILLSEAHILPCTGCETCLTHKACHIRDDDMADIYAAYKACDAILIAAPTYWRNVPAQLKAVFDRTHAAEPRPLAGKPGGAIAVGRGSGAGQSIVLNVIHNFYLSCGAFCVPGELNGVTAVADKPGDIAQQPRRLMQAAQLGQNILAHISRYH
ncbi:flavodoxin family protein [Ruminococcaceae bacterium OttesenSCG-928-L11]|nr:flavodoxin family protein [Ruminococcaceae bacterium OttesenSCG-928-L11]